MDLGVYIHFPWCRARCPYCDFAIAVPRGHDPARIPHARYAGAVLEELAARAPRFAGRRLCSIYLGGGTPSLWEPAQVARVLAAVRATFSDAAAAVEITVEANPLDCASGMLARLRAAGVNRLSIGAQSFDDGELRALGRDHDAARAAAAVTAARAAGFDEISLDLIYALPGRGLADLRRNLDRALELAPEHLSVYQLTVEPRTSFGAAARAGRLVPPPDETAAEQFEAADAILTAAGFQHYEVSSYARPGHRAVHNSLYWTGAEYLGLGSGAHSFWRDGGRGLRWSAHRSVVRYLAGAPAAELSSCGLVAEVGEQDERGLRQDRVWLGMRTADGVPRELLADERPLAGLVAAGLVAVEDARIRPTRRGLLFADEIGARLLE